MVELEGSAKMGHNIAQIFEQLLEVYETSGASFKISSTKTIGESLIKTFKFKKASKTLSCCLT
jgi:DNA polymerase I-like protein with 3'-5' exonuclease and polymerase domains